MMKARLFLMTAFATLMIGAVMVSAEDAPEVTEPVINTAETTTATPAPPDVLLGDANWDGVMNVRDCALIAHDLNLNFTRSANAPNKADYDLNNIAEMKRYINDTVIRKATEKYGITDIMADDNVKSNT